MITVVAPSDTIRGSLTPPDTHFLSGVFGQMGEFFGTHLRRESLELIHWALPVASGETVFKLQYGTFLR